MAHHPLTYRILWTWDSWICDPFSADSFVTEYRSLIDFAAGAGYNGLVIWGFLDGRHGGIDSARQVASYGAERGVRVLPGIGAGGYHGFAISRGMPFNLDDFLAQNPHLRAVPRSGVGPSGQLACLYQKQTLDWLREGARWLAETFEIGGVNIETNEMGGIDVCDHAAEATDAEPNRLRYAASFRDLAAAVPVVYDEVKRARPDAWVSYATYEPPWWQRAEDNWLLAAMPHDAIAQWNLEMSVNPGEKPPVAENVALIHSGGWSYHLGAFPPTWTFTQLRCFNPLLAQAREFAIGLAPGGVQGFALGNAGSAAMPDNEINYLAWIEFSRDPALSVTDFSKRFVAPLYGGQAQDLVLRLMLKQPKIHQQAVKVWRPLASLLFFGCVASPIQVCGEELIAELEGQLGLAKRASAVASESGRTRLAVVRDVLREYLAVARMSRHPEVASMLNLPQEAGHAAGEAARRTLAELAESYKVPASLYGYRRGA